MIHCVYVYFQWLTPMPVFVDCWLVNNAKRFSNPYFITLIVLLYKLDPNKFEINSYVRLSIVTIMTATIHSSSNWITKTSTKANQCKQTPLYYYLTFTYIGQQPSYRDNWNCAAVNSGPTLFRSILTHCLLYKYIVWSHIFISLLSSMFSSTLLIVCTISVVPVRWLSLSVICPSSGFHVYYP